MYGKKLYVVVTFETTSQAIHFEQSSTVKGRLIPLPSTISAGCGLACGRMFAAKGKENNL